MKNLLKIVLLTTLVSLTLTSQAQTFSSQSFIANASSLNVSNTFGITNLLAPSTYGSNVVSVLFTNRAGTRVVVAAGTGETVNLCASVNLWPDRNGNWWSPLYQQSTNGTPLQIAPYPGMPASLTVRLIGGSGANVAMLMKFVPVFDGDNESTVAAEAFDWSVTPNTTTAVCISTNVPLYKWPGAKKLRLKSITAGDTDASSQVTIFNLSLNGYVP